MDRGTRVLKIRHACSLSCGFPPSLCTSSVHGAPLATCLVQRGLRDRVLLNEQAVLVGDEQPEDPGQRGGGDLELEHVVVSLPLHAAREVSLEELFHWIQVRKQVFLWGFDFHCDNVAISKPRGQAWWHA